jgi:hypothetical protein
MIISHKHQFIFIKTSKTAGTSLEIALSAICGMADVITTISPIDEKARLEMGIWGPRNYENGQGPPFRTHATAAEVEKNIGPEIWNNYFKFCFERNPWDKVISHYYWQKRKIDYPNLRSYLDAGELLNIKGFEHYTLNGKVVVDEIYRFEHIDSAMDDISARLQLASSLKMPVYKAKSQFRTSKLPYQQLFTAEEAKIVGDFFHREIDLLGYSY